MPTNNRNTLTNPTTAWSDNFLLNNNGDQGLDDLGYSAWMKTRVADANASAELTKLTFSAFAKTLPPAADGGAFLRLLRLPWYNTADYADLNALVTAAGAGPYVVNVDTHVHVTANLTLGSGIRLLFEPGVTLEVNNAVTLTINSPEHVLCSLREQAWTKAGTGKVLFTNPGTISPCWWGASPAAAAATNAGAMNAAADAMIAGMEYYLPPGEYTVNDALAFHTIAPLTTLTNVRIILDGIIYNATNGKSGVTFTDMSFFDVAIRGMQRLPADWTGSDAAIKLIGDIAHFRMFVGVVMGWANAWLCDTTDDHAIGYGQVTILRLEENYNHVYIKTHDEHTWAGAMRFDLGSMTNQGHETETDWAIYLDVGDGGAHAAGSRGSIHSIKFNTPKVEGFGNAFYLVGAYNIAFDELHVEAIDHTVFDLRGMVGMHLSLCPLSTSWEDMATAGGILTDANTRGIIVDGADKLGSTAYRSRLADQTHGGESTIHQRDYRNKPSNLYVDNYYGGVFLDHQSGATGFLDKHYADASGEPAAGTFTPGAICWRNPFVSGQPAFKQCTVYGTEGTLAGVTATTSVGDKTVTVNSVADLRVGQRIAIAGGSGLTDTQITDITDATHIEVANAETVAVVAQAVSFKAPTWVAGPNAP